MDRRQFRSRRIRHGCCQPGAKEDQMKYKIVLHKSDEGHSVSCPGLPGCWSEGETEEEAIENKDAISEYLAAIEETLRNSDVQQDVREVEIYAHTLDAKR